MAEDFIEELYSRAEIVTKTKIAQEFALKHQVIQLRSFWNGISRDISEFCVELQGIDMQTSMDIWDDYEELCRISRENMVGTADMLECIIGKLYSAIALYGSIDVIDGDYRLFSSRSGYISIQDTRDQRLLCSGLDPMWEAYQKAQVLYSHEMRNFCTFGCNLGYLAYQMYKQSAESIDIYVFDLDHNMFEYAMHYGVLEWIPRDHLHLIIEPNPDKLLERSLEFLDDFEHGNVFNFEKDVVDRLSEQGKLIAKKLDIGVQTARDFSKLWEINYFRNKLYNTKDITSIVRAKDFEEYIVLGGGPSVDYNMEFIKESQGKKGIIAATTIFEKLIKNGIKPDFIVAVDPSNRIYGHIKNIEEHDVPLIITDKTACMLTAKYKGEIYVVPTGNNVFSNELYKLKRTKTWEVGGTVTCLCINVSVYLGAKKIYLIGLDLAFPGKKSHAEGTMDFKAVDDTNLFEVKSTNGGMVYTDMVMNGYREDIETVISNNTSVEFYNLSRDGAYIKGCRNI